LNSKQQSIARIVVDRLATKVDILGEDTILGLDIFSWYNSAWNFGNVQVMTITQKAEKVNDSELS
jgi:hypothetical protein